MQHEKRGYTMKRSIFCIFLALILLLSACGAEQKELPAPADEQVCAPAPAAEVQEELPEEPPEELTEEPPELPTEEEKKTELPGGLLVIQDLSRYVMASSGYQVAIYNGKIVKKGRLTSVNNLATGEAVGFLCETFIPRPGSEDSEDYYWRNTIPKKYELYHADGSFWCDCDSLYITGILGDYFFGAAKDNENSFIWGARYYTKDPTDPDSFRLAPTMYCAGNDRCLIENNNHSDFLGIDGFAMVNNALEILTSCKRPNGNYEVYDVGQTWEDKTYYLDPKNGEPCINLCTMEETPYTEMKQLCGDEYDYRIRGIGFREKSGSYGLMDWNGKVVLSDWPQEITDYSGKLIKLSDGCFYTIADGRPGKQLALESDDKAILYGDYLYVQKKDADEVTCYDSRLEVCAAFPAESTWSMWVEGNILRCKDRRIFRGGPYVVKEDDDYYLHDLDWAVPFDEKNCYVYENYSAYPDISMTLLNDRGETIRSGFSLIIRTDYPHIYAAKKEDRWGLIDQDGNWLWTQYVGEE